MHPFLIVIHLAAAVMLLLWAVRMVRTGVERGWGAELRAAMRGAGGGVTGMALAGMALAVVLQCATAVAVLATGFAASGLIGAGVAIAAVLGPEDAGAAAVLRRRLEGT